MPPLEMKSQVFDLFTQCSKVFFVTRLDIEALGTKHMSVQIRRPTKIIDVVPLLCSFERKLKEVGIVSLQPDVTARLHQTLVCIQKSLARKSALDIALPGSRIRERDPDLVDLAGGKEVLDQQNWCA